MAADPLSDVLELIQARCELSGCLVAGSAWARRFANRDAVKFCAATQGACWYFMEGMAEPAPFRAGDVLVMNGSHALVLASDPALIARAGNTALAQDRDGCYSLGIGSDFRMLGGMVRVDTRRQSLLLGGLPPVLHVPGATPDSVAIGWLLDQLVREMGLPERPGRVAITAELAQLLFVHTLRAYLARADGNGSGWLKGLGDSRLASALGRMHTQPAHPWGLDELAAAAGMSRTAFAIRFRGAMGVPPMAYLTQWRMHVAERQLLSGATVAQAADSAGYTSESAFSHAFKRVMGVAPGRCRKVDERTDQASVPGHGLHGLADAF